MKNEKQTKIIMNNERFWYDVVHWLYKIMLL